MVSKEKIIETIVSFLNIKLDEIAINMPILSLFRPIVTTGINNKLNKLDNLLSFIADDSGMIDAEKIIGEMLIVMFKMNLRVWVF